MLTIEHVRAGVADAEISTTAECMQRDWLLGGGIWSIVFHEPGPEWRRVNMARRRRVASQMRAVQRRAARRRPYSTQ